MQAHQIKMLRHIGIIGREKQTGKSQTPQRKQRWHSRLPEPLLHELEGIQGISEDFMADVVPQSVLLHLLHNYSHGGLNGLQESECRRKMHSLASIICGRDELQDLSQDQILLLVKAFERRAIARHGAGPQKGKQGGVLHHELFYRLEPYILKFLFDRQLTG